MKSGYKSDSSYNTAIRKALRDNDPRIKEAAEAVINGDFDKYTRLAEEIIGEGNFSEPNVVAAINSEINGMTEGEKKSDSSVDKEVSLYKMDYVYEEALNGDFVMAHAMKEDLIQTAVRNGKSREDAEKSFNNSFTSEVKERFEAGELSSYEARNLLKNFGGKSDEESASKVQHWEFKQDYPDYELSEDAVKKYYNDVAPHGINVRVYYDYYERSSACKGVDSNGDGKTDSGSKKAQILNVIHSLPITSAQKDALYRLNGWAESALNEAPWH
jgi:hypothetical protein